MRRMLPVLVMLTVALVGAQAGSYRITRTYQVGGEGSWDYVVPDPPNHRLFIARQNRVMVIDEDNGKLLGEVMGINGAHGTAIAAPSGHGFATSGNDRSVVMFDLKPSRPSISSCRKLLTPSSTTRPRTACSP